MEWPTFTICEYLIDYDGANPAQGANYPVKKQDEYIYE